MTTNVLFLCTHNSARSILAEAMLNHQAARLGHDVRGYSAGSAPSGRVNALALAVLADAGIATTEARSKSWDEFARPDAPHLRIVITVCDSAAKETCPIWPGAPVPVHWSYPDPSTTSGNDAMRRNAFELTRQAIGYRVLQLLALPLESASDAQLRHELLGIASS
jgi:arsenate reductase